LLAIWEGFAFLFIKYLWYSNQNKLYLTNSGDGVMMYYLLSNNFFFCLY